MHQDERSYSFRTDISRTGKAILHVLDERKRRECQQDATLGAEARRVQRMKREGCEREQYSQFH